MKGCLQAVAGVAAFLFVITAVAALFLVNLVRVVDDRSLIKQALNDLDALVVQAVPALVTQALQEQARQQGLPPLNLDDAALQAAVNELVPAEWLDQQTTAAVDNVYDSLENGALANGAEPEIILDTTPILERLRGEPGRRVVAAVVAGLPVCSDPLNVPPLGGGDVPVPSCLPPGVPAAQVTEQVHGALVASLEQNPQLGRPIRLPLFGAVSGEQGESLVQARLRLQRWQRNVALARQWSWLLWLLPAACLVFMTLLAVRSLSEWGHWWGWPLLITALVALFLAVLLPAFFAFGLRTAVFPGSATVLEGPLRQFASTLFDALTDVWLSRVFIQAGISLVAGVVLIVVGFIAGAARRR